MENKDLKLDFSFKTERLIINQYNLPDTANNHVFAEDIIKILTPNVTKALPNGWQNINTESKALHWIKERDEESAVLLVESSSGNNLIGFIFLYPVILKNNQMDIRFGYLLSETHWGKGLGTELINGLVKKCQDLNCIKSISGGVEKDNIASKKVLEKCGFHAIDNEEEAEAVVFYEKHLSEEGRLR